MKLKNFLIDPDKPGSLVWRKGSDCKLQVSSDGIAMKGSLEQFYTIGFNPGEYDFVNTTAGVPEAAIGYQSPYDGSLFLTQSVINGDLPEKAVAYCGSGVFETAPFNHSGTSPENV